ncbi:MAG: ABC transporter permease [Nitriliruptoraceae bacterium]
MTKATSTGSAISTLSLTAAMQLKRRNRRFGIFSIAAAVVMLSVFATTSRGGTATFVLNDARGQFFMLPNLSVPVLPTVLLLVGIVLAIAFRQFTTGFGSKTVIIVGVVAALFVLAFMTWAAADGQLSLISLLRGTLARATPIALGALAGVLCERAGVINIAIEGQFLAGAFTAALFASMASNAWVGLIGGIGAGVLVAFMLAGLTIKFQADQIVVGVVLIVLATGVTSFLTTQVMSPNPHLNSPTRFRTIAIPLLSEIPLIGPVLFRQSVLVFGMIAIVGILQYSLFQTRWGLRLRSVGEHPKAADTVGIKVLATRYKAVLLGGVMAGMGGAYFTLDAVGSFSKDMSGGRGFIALAAMLVGRYSPVGAFGAALIFGFSDALATSLQLLRVPVPSNLLLTAPYVVTLAVVAGLIGRLKPPAAGGKPYVKE